MNKTRLLISSGSLLIWACANFPIVSSQNSQPPYKNPTLPLPTRVDDLISRMTLEEKVSQMMNVAPAIPRLGIPEYDWWNEGLHGVAFSGVATVFPQAIGLGATFDQPLVNRVASVISEEARAKYNEAQRRENRSRFYGLTFWSPNINIFRDPRWGRGQETYGEDPYLRRGLRQGTAGRRSQIPESGSHAEALCCALRSGDRASPL
ncbi:MAG TPA: glycoside hydrolase family 3 N-terminal domain-containing protein [Pyrinomonadaceae bacterium]|nr:glycoside hydrolase family 3 N-terminal domain-containing protein [Pyrinomonadaceae bacterium]